VHTGVRDRYGTTAELLGGEGLGKRAGGTISVGGMIMAKRKRQQMKTDRDGREGRIFLSFFRFLSSEFYFYCF
jgi:hypothetical protein